MPEPNQPEDYGQRLRHSTAAHHGVRCPTTIPRWRTYRETRNRSSDRKRVLLRYGSATPITPDDFPEIEKHMKAMIKANVPFEQETWTYDAAREWFGERDQKFKLELIDGISDREVNASDEGVADEGVSIYHNGDFTDLCKGPHVEKTGECRYFKLLRVSGAYWRGDGNPRAVTTYLRYRMETKADLQAYLTQRQEAAKRDHRRLGRELELFQMHPDSPGSPFGCRKGRSSIITCQKKFENSISVKGIKKFVHRSSTTAASGKPLDIGNTSKRICSSSKARMVDQ